MEDIWANEAEHELPLSFFETLPQPMFWRVLVMPKSAQQRSKGGIYLAAASQEAEQHLTYVGKILAVGSKAFTDERLGDKAEVGEWVIYGRYAGQRLEHKGVKLILINDDEILAKAPNHESLRIYV
jgi:co-chaperonin GroES (HSP10)